MNMTVSLSRFRILVADPDTAEQQEIALALGDAGRYDLTMVPDGRAALVAAQGGRFDLLLLDQNIPHITCDRVIRHLRSGNSGNARTPVIRLTTQPIKTLSQNTNGLIDIVLSKPVHRDSLCYAIDSILRLTH